MLVLSRRVNERIVIDGEIHITVLEVARNGQVRLGIEAPRHYQIYRHEILVAIETENREAAGASEAAALTGPGQSVAGLLDRLARNVPGPGAAVHRRTPRIMPAGALAGDHHPHRT